MAKSKKKAGASPTAPEQHRRGYGWSPDLPGPSRSSLFGAAQRAHDAAAESGPSAPVPAGLRSGPVGELHRQLHRSGIRVRPDQAEWQGSHAFPAVYLLQRAGHRRNGRLGRRAQIRDGIKSIGQQGVCPETDWPYVLTEFAVKPPASAYSDAAKNKAISYQRIARTLPQMKGCAAAGYPWVFGFTVYESFESPQVAQTGIVPMPAATEKVLGGHAVLCVGYDDSQRCFIVRNSWARDGASRGIS